MTRLREYLKERNISENSLEANSILEGYEKGYQDAIEKACEVLKKYLFTQVVGRYDGEYSHFIQEIHTQVFPKFTTAEDMIMVLRNEMED